jgi:hypothetical protein
LRRLAEWERQQRDDAAKVNSGRTSRTATRCTAPVAVSCRICRGFLAATSRMAVELFDEAHSTQCGPAAVTIGGSLDDILDLPPY